MHKLLISFALAGGLGFAQTQTDPQSDTRKTAQQKGYHEAHPKNTGPTPPETKKQQEQTKADKDRKARDKDGLQDQTPPTYQPNLKPPPKS